MDTTLLDVNIVPMVDIRFFKTEKLFLVFGISLEPPIFSVRIILVVVSSFNFDLVFGAAQKI